MSYSRFSENCGVYIYWDVSEKLTCCGCSLEGHTIMFDTVEELIEHLKKHKEQGEKVPEYLFDVFTYKDFLKEHPTKLFKEENK